MKFTLKTTLTGLMAALFLIVPIYAQLTGDSYSLMLFGRIAVYMLAALGLNLALGYGGMISMGHALYLGIGAYSVALLSAYGMHNGWLHLVTALAVSTVLATIIGSISLRTKGVAFIMITLAFAQMGYFVMVSLRQYGGDDGMSLDRLSDFGVLTGNRTALYLSLLVVIALCLYGIHRLLAARFGLVLRASCANPVRVNAVGTNTYPYQLFAYVLSAQICAVAGYFLANLTGYVSPAYMAWYISGELIAMVLLGGVGTLLGPVVGAAVMLLLEEGLKAMTEHWAIILGPFLVFIVIYMRRGIWGLIDRSRPEQGGH
jgi:branched-chain amino acid transport system permease protein